VLATPFLVVVLGAGLALLAAASLWSAGPWSGLAYLVESGLEALVAVVEFGATWPGAVSAAERPEPWVLCLWPLLFLPLDGRLALLERAAVLGLLILCWSGL